MDQRISIVTKTGDRGTTGLFGGKRVSKANARLHAYGTVDELNAVLGVVLSDEALPQEFRDPLLIIQRALFTVGADLATPSESSAKIKRVGTEEIAAVEQWIEALEQALPQLQRFILPSGSRLGSLMHQARTVCRRAERWVVGLAEEEQINLQVQVYLNRLSDYLFLAARAVNRAMGAGEVEV